MTEAQTSGVPDVYRAICKVTAEMSRDGIAKNKSNQQQGYKFRGIDDIYNALSAVISGAGLCILPRMSDRGQEERQTAKGGTLFYVTVRAEFDLVSMKDGSKHTVCIYGEAMDSADKATNKAMSAAFKYACMQVFCIPTEGMDDADAHTPEPSPKSCPIPTAKQIAESKIAAMRDGRGYAEVSAPDPRSEPMDEKAAAGRKQMLEQFSKIKEKIGDKAYFGILGANGVERPEDITSLNKGREVYKLMATEYDDQTRSRGVA